MHDTIIQMDNMLNHRGSQNNSKIKSCRLGFISFWMMILFQTHSSCWLNSVPCSYIIEYPFTCCLAPGMEGKRLLPAPRNCLQEASPSSKLATEYLLNVESLLCLENFLQEKFLLNGHMICQVHPV